MRLDEDRVLFSALERPVEADDVRVDDTWWWGPMQSMDRSSGRITMLLDEESVHLGRRDASPHLTPLGAIFTHTPGDLYDGWVYDYRSGSLVELGEGHMRGVSGEYAIWSNFLRDLISGTNIPIPPGVDRDVSSNGDVVYHDNNVPYDDVYRFRDGAAERIARGSAPDSDGINIVYKLLEHSIGGNYGIYMVTADGVEIELQEWVYTEPNSGIYPHRGEDYQANNGWVAFNALDEDEYRHLWLRTPIGFFEQLSFSAFESEIDHLGPEGEVMYFVNGSRHLGVSGEPTNDPIALSSDLGRSFFVDGRWYVVIGGTLFRVRIPNIEPDDDWDLEVYREFTPGM